MSMRVVVDAIMKNSGGQAGEQRGGGSRGGCLSSMVAYVVSVDVVASSYAPSMKVQGWYWWLNDDGFTVVVSVVWWCG
ncbi:hypothetical protein SESBI_44678 [Sesbania bispinosa]|nr:hypothetical protein SESBI_44678 [Sesbania bispinosa]